MALPVRARPLPRCLACLRSYAVAVLDVAVLPCPTSRQHIRGKKKLAKAPSTVPVRLLKDVKTFGRAGSIVPVSMGQMRNNWFPRRTAEYVTLPERRQLRLKNIAAERDFDFGITNLAKESLTTADSATGKWQKNIPNDVKGMSTPELREASMFQKKDAEVKRLSPERSTALIDIFVPARLDFYRQPIIEEKNKELETPAPPPTAPPKQRGQRGASSAADDLIAARSEPAPEPSHATRPITIYDSVSTHDILMALRAVMRGNEEAAQVVLHEEDISFVNLSTKPDGTEIDRVKHIGEFAIEIRAKGAEKALRRAVKVVAQEA